MNDTLLVAIIGPPLAIAGWIAWTGRWRSWAHPYSGTGLLPILALPLGLAATAASLIDLEGDLAWWENIFVLPILIGLLALPVMTVNLFVHIKRVPGFLRPRWLPPNWRAPRFVDARSVGISALTGPGVDPSSEEAAAMVTNGRAPLARWHVLHVDDDPDVPFLHQMLPGWRWCYLYVHPGLVVVAQRKREDRLRGAPFLLVLPTADVEHVRYIQAPRWSWKFWFYHRTHYPLPRLVLETPDGPHHLAVIDGGFRRHADRSLALLEEALKVPVTR